MLKPSSSGGRNAGDAKAAIIRAQPDYHSEVSQDYIKFQQDRVDSKKPAKFKLTPVGDAGW